MKKIIPQTPSFNSNQRIARPKHERRIPKQVTEVAQNFEEQFARFLIKQMEKSVPSSSLTGTAGKFYKSLMNNERAKAMAAQGLGIKNIIIEQLYPTRRPRPENATIGIKQYQKEISDE